MTQPSWLAVAIAGAGGFLAGVLLVAVLGGPKGVTQTTTTPVTRVETITRTIDGRDQLPDVVGDVLRDARDTLAGAGFRVEVEADSLFGVVDPDNWVVSQQDPGAGERVTAGATVTLTVERR